MFLRSKKVISALIIFVILFTYMGQTLEAIATTDGLSVVTNGFFKTEKMNFSTYFKEENEQRNEKIIDVNEKTTLFFEISPTEIGQGFLKEGTISANSLQGDDTNFKFSKIKNVFVDEPEDVGKYEEDKMGSENVENQVIENEIENNIVENETEDFENEIVENNVGEDIILNEVLENSSKENQDEVISRAAEARDVENEEQELVNEEQVIEDLTEEIKETYEELTAKDFEIEIVKNDEIKIQNVIFHTMIEVEIECNQKEEFDISDLYQEIALKLEGSYINVNLEKAQVEAEQKILIGWSYHQDFEVRGEYTQFSPFKLGEHTGILVENKITVKREVRDEKYLPIKETVVEVEVPEYNGNLPETVNVQASKLMTTRGEDIGNVTFGTSDWEYDAESKKIMIHISNEKLIETMGEDEYIIVYRYNDYTEDEMVSLPNIFRVAVEEYSANETKTTTKEFSEVQSIKTQINDLITYNIASTEEKLDKAKINANYNFEETMYETEFTTTVNVNILTSDLLEELKIDSSKERYISKNASEFDAMQDVYYSKIKFNFQEIKNMLTNGASIEIQNLSGEVLHILKDESVQSQSECEILLANKEKGILVVFRNIAVNGNISVEFTKAIGKSNYDKLTFYNFSEIKSYVSAELKYQNYDERYAMEEIVATKKLQESKTVAEISLTNNNLNTIAKNDNVEVRIALNNDKQDTDFYKNPVFELVFPKYITKVDVEKINLMYGCGLEIANYEIFTQDNFVKLRIELAGIQNKFSESAITSGTNIILNLNLTLEEYTPRKQDQIKMYYYNEAVTNYKAQTRWTVNKSIPNDILKDTNGFAVAMINYQAPSGLVTSNAIINYDGQNSKIGSINQGEKMAEINTYSNAQIAKMELVASNNTNNVCSDVVFLGKIPFEGNTSVITKKDFGTNITTKMLNSIQPDSQNSNATTIYYSTNEKVTQDLNDSTNGWTTEVEDFSQIKSYRIAVEGNFSAGAILKFTYDFEIPEQLSYDKVLYGSFGGFYNNLSENLVSYESTEADKVGLATEKTPDYRITVKPKNDNNNICYGQIVTLAVEVENNSKGDLKDDKLYVTIPTGTVYTESSLYVDDLSNKIQEYIDDESVTFKEFAIDNLAVGEKKTFEFQVKVNDSDADLTALDGYAELKGANQKYRLEARKGDIRVKANFALDMSLPTKGDEINYGVSIANNTGATIKNVIMACDLPSYLEISSVSTYEKELNYSSESGKLLVDIGEVPENGETIFLHSTIGDLPSNYLIANSKFSVWSNDNREKVYDSNELHFETGKADLDVKQTINQTEFNLGDTFEMRILVTNNSKATEPITINQNVPKYLNINDTRLICNGEEQELYSFNGVNIYKEIQGGETVEVVLTGEVNMTFELEEDYNFVSIFTVNTKGGNKKQSNPLNLVIHAYENNYVKEETENGEYSISGNVYADISGNIKSQVQVQLLKDSTMVQATATDSYGNYSFQGLKEGEYSVVYTYDEDSYISSPDTSETMEIEEGVAVTDTLTIENNSLSNINAGLVEKEKFDLKVDQYLTNASIQIDDESESQDFENLSLAKLEIEPNNIDKAVVKLTYKIVVTNVGSVSGKATSIVDYIPNGMTFYQSENENWSTGVMEGSVYNDELKGVDIAPGESKEVILVLTKHMTEDNTGIVSNKVRIAYAESNSRLTEAISNNFATQETIITLTQGVSYKMISAVSISMIAIVGMFGFMVATGRIEVSFNLKNGIKKIYK